MVERFGPGEKVEKCIELLHCTLLSCPGAAVRQAAGVRRALDQPSPEFRQSAPRTAAYRRVKRANPGNKVASPTTL